MSDYGKLEIKNLKQFAYTKKQIKINAYIMVLYLFQFGILQLLAGILQSQSIIIGFTLMLLALMLLNNQFRVKIYVLNVFFFLNLYFVFSVAIAKTPEEMFFNYMYFLLKGFSGFLFGSLSTNGEELFAACINVALINFAILSLKMFGIMGHMNYMRYGYAMVPSTLIFAFAFISKKNPRILWFFLATISGIMAVLLGARGTLVVITLFFVLYLIKNNYKKKYVKISLILFMTIVVLLTVNKSTMLGFIDFLDNVTESKSYFLIKMRLGIEKGLLMSSSGRDVIYGKLWGDFMQKPVLGNGPFFSTINYKLTPHNIILQILLESGLLGLTIWLTIWIVLNRKYSIVANKNKSAFGVLTVMLSLSLGRLLVSSDIWLRSEFWLALSLILNMSAAGD